MADGPRLTWFGRVVVFAVILACGFLAYRYLIGDKVIGRNSSASDAANNTSAPAGTGQFGIAYGTEKKAWLEWAVHAYQQTNAGKHAQITLVPLGSLEAAQALIAGDKRLNVWSPASAVYTEIFQQEWAVKQPGTPIVRSEALALTPMVFVMWDERYQAFVRKFGSVSFDTIRMALQAQGGWQEIAGHADWGLFKFGHTHPNQSNSGIITLVAMAYEYHKKTRGLELQDILDPGFQKWMGEIESGVTGLSNSTGNMMRQMILQGPSSFDALFVYESVVIENLRNAEGRWGKLHVIYPDRNIWNDNPYYVLDTPWTSDDQRHQAEQFLDFLLSQTVQEQALVHGFRPGNPNVPVLTPDGPFTAYASVGLRNEVKSVCEPPRAEVITNLLSSWQRQYGARAH